MNDMQTWTPGTNLEQWEKIAIEAAFRFYRGNKTQTSIALGISIRTLDSKLEKYEFDRQLIREQYEKDKIERSRILDKLRGVTPADTAEVSRSSLYRADSGVHLESTPLTTPQHPVSMPERKEVQTVLSNESTTSGVRGRRSKV